MIAGRMQLGLMGALALAAVASPCAAAPPRESLEISARAGVAVWIDGRREILGLIGVTIPLDRAVAPPRVFAEPGARRDKKAKSDDDAPSPSLETRAPTSEYQPTPPRLTFALARATMRAAYRAHDRSLARERHDSLSSRARASAALPELRLRAGRTTDQSLRLAPTSTDPYRYTQAGGVSVSLEAQATWRLDRLVFADEEVRIEHLRRLRARADEVLADKVLHALFAWQRALTEAERPDLLPEERVLSELRVLEAELTLDTLTGGWFGAHAATRVRADD